MYAFTWADVQLFWDNNAAGGSAAAGPLFFFFSLTRTHTYFIRYRFRCPAPLPSLAPFFTCVYAAVSELRERILWFTLHFPATPLSRE